MLCTPKARKDNVLFKYLVARLPKYLDLQLVLLVHHATSGKREKTNVTVASHLAGVRYIPLIWCWPDGTTIPVELFVIELSVRISMLGTRWTMEPAHLECDAPKRYAKMTEKKNVQKKTEIELTRISSLFRFALFARVCCSWARSRVFGCWVTRWWK